ncbi:MAG: PAS domain-containing protein [Gammaproteobacteria bacterium]|nr:PAS domain-containing protein [Gammaproteobacteria bacterium]
MHPNDLEYRILTKDGDYMWIHDHTKIVQCDTVGSPLPMSGTHTHISEQKNIEQEKDELVNSLKEALSEIKAVRGIIPICSYCHNIRNE